MDCVMKWGNRFINSIRNFFICLKVFSIGEKKASDEIKRMGTKNW